MLTKLVDGKEVVCTQEEEAAILAYWEFNTKYPKYYDACQFDGFNMPVIFIDKAKEMHQQQITWAVDQELIKITEAIQIAAEDGDDTTALLAKRKLVRSYKNMDLTNISTMDDLVEAIPQELISYFNA